MPEIELAPGTIDYLDTGGPGPVVVLLHGLVHDETVWRKVVADLERDHRCVVPTLPYGAHLAGPERPVRHLAALSESSRYVQYENDPPPCDAPHRTPRAHPRRSGKQDLGAPNRGLRKTELL